MSENPQQSGAFSTQPIPNTVRSIIIQKDKNTQTVALTQDMSVIESLKINKGALDQRKAKLTIPRAAENP